MATSEGGPLELLIGGALRQRGPVLIAAALAVGLGLETARRVDVDAFPDTTPVQVQINAAAPALGPEEVERQLTLPLELALGGLPGLEEVRSISKFGLCQVVATFQEGTDVHRARQGVSERLAAVELPPGLGRPELGPMSTGLGEVFHYLLRGPDSTRLRSLQDWVLRPGLRSVPGTAEINGWGGRALRWEVRVDPARLVRHGLTLAELIGALRASNLNVGGGVVPEAGAALLLQGVGRLTAPEDVARVVVAARDGVPIRVGDLGRISAGHSVRRGAVCADGRGEAVLGLGFMLQGENSHQVSGRLRERLNSLRATLPADAGVEVVYDRTQLVDRVLDTVRRNLFEGGLLVVAVLFAFLGSLRAGLIVALAIPFSLLAALTGMVKLGISASLLSLGAMDFGLVVDSSVILIENASRRLAEDGGRRPRLEVVREAALEVRRPTLFGELIILVVYLPILTLEGVEGRLFRPMALTVVLALAGSLILSLTVVPVLASLLLPREAPRREPLLIRLAQAGYVPLLRLALRQRALVLGGAALLLGITGLAARGLGADFVPRLSEGSLVLNVVRLAGTDLDESVRYATRLEQAVLRAFPDEVARVWTRIGSADVATDPMGLEVSDVFITLRPTERWRRARNQTELEQLLMRELRDLPGQRLALTQPIEMRLNEMTSGVRADVALKLFGDDLPTLVRLGRELESALRGVSGAADLSVEQVTGQPVLQVRLDPEALARYGVQARDALELVEAAAGVPVGELYQSQRSWPLVVTLPPELRASPADLAALVLPGPKGEEIPLGRLARLERIEGPATITREWGQRRITIQMNVRGRDLESFLEEARRAVAGVSLPTDGRYRLEWGGQFQHLERARRRLAVVVPLALALVLALLTISQGSLGAALLMFACVPLAAVGGVLALWLGRLPLSLPAVIGFVALAGIAVLNGLVLIAAAQTLVRAGVEPAAAIEQAAIERLRPVLMTGLVAALGFLPMALSQGVGAEVQRPLARVVIGGIASSCLLTLLVLPALASALPRLWRPASP